MSDGPDGPAGQDEPWPPDIPALTVGGRAFEFSGDYRGNISALELTEAEEDYRRQAHEAVRHYAGDRGLSLIPVWWMASQYACACRDGESCPSPGKHPCDLRWPEVATSDPEQAARWWRQLEPGETLPVDWRPQANVGVVTGEKYFILDVDTDAGKQGEASLARLVAEGGEAMPATLTYRTGGGGRQHIMAIPEGIEVRSSNSKLADGIDVKGVRSYGILPPSRSGKGEYVMISDLPPDVHPPAWLADWLREQHRKRTEHIRSVPAGDLRQIPQDGMTKRAHAYVTAALADAASKVAAAPDRHRNQTLNDEAFALFSKFGRAGFLSADDIEAALWAAAEASGLLPREIAGTIRSAARGGQVKDRSGELPDFLYEEPGSKLSELAKSLIKPDPLTDRMTTWLPRDVETAVTGLDPDGRVPLDGDIKKDNSPYDVLRLAWAVALGHASPHIATHGRELKVVSGGEGGSLDIGELTPRRLRSMCASANLTYYHHVKEIEDEAGNVVDVEEWDEPALPSIQLCSTALADPAIKLYRPQLGGITKVPVLRPDRTLLEVQGIDAATSRVYWPDLPVGTIPAKPTRSEVAAAKKLILDELLHDFPWSSAADKANCLGMWLTSYLEPYAEYLSPLFALDATKASSGKSGLVMVMQETVGAYFRTWVNLEEEIRKSLTACLMEADPVIIFDDVGKGDTVSSATLASALTKRQWDDRILGVSKNFRGENNRTWCLTGNNLKLGGDIPSRSVLISLDPGPVDPKTRNVADFRLGDIRTWVTRDENKVRLIRALLTLITAWADHGAPRSTVQHRFADWAAIAGGVLEHHEIGDFLANQVRVEEHVNYDEHLGDFFARWFELYQDVPQGVKKLRDTLGKDAERQNDLLWKGQWPRGKRSQLLSWKALGQELREAVGQDHNGYQVDAVSDGHGGVLFKVSVVIEKITVILPIGEEESSQPQLLTT